MIYCPIGIQLKFSILLNFTFETSDCYSTNVRIKFLDRTIDIRRSAQFVNIFGLLFFSFIKINDKR